MKLENVCDEIIEENTNKWKKRKIDEELRKILENEKIEKMLEEERKRNERLERARQRKEECLERLSKRKEILVVKEGKSKNWIQRKQR